MGWVCWVKEYETYWVLTQCWEIYHKISWIKITHILKNAFISKVDLGGKESNRVRERASEKTTKGRVRRKRGERREGGGRKRESQRSRILCFIL